MKRLTTLLLITCSLCGGLFFARADKPAPPATARPAQTGVADTLALEGDEFARKAEHLTFLVQIKKIDATPAELWQLVDKLQKEHRKAGLEAEKNIQYVLLYPTLTELILQSHGPADFERLMDVYDALPADSYARRLMIEPLSAFLIEREIAALEEAKQPLQVPTPEFKRALPEQLKHASPTLENAWRTYRAVVASYDAELPRRQETKQISVQENWPLFHKLAAEIMRGRVDGAVARLTEFDWGGMCGTGSDQFYAPQQRLLFLTLLRERRYSAALGAVLKLNTYRSFEDRPAQWRRTFIRLCGHNWEHLFAGAALDGQPTLGDLAKEGSAKAAEYLVQMGALPAMTERDDYMRAAAGFITGSGLPTGYGTGSSADIRRTAPPIPDEIQQQLLAILHAQVKPDASLQTIDTLSHILTDKARPESKAALDLILKMPYGQASARAALALTALGVPTAAKAARPVTFQLLVNGEAAKGTKVNWDMKAGDTGGVSSSRVTDDKGRFSLERDYMLDPKRPITQLRFSAAHLKSPRDVWFDIVREQPANLDAVTPLAVRSHLLAVTVTSNRPAGFYDGREIEVHLQAERNLYGMPLYDNVAEFMKLPMGAPIEFASLQSGKYRVELFAPGAARWEGDITLDAPGRLEAKLQPGADVKFEIVAPGGDTRDRNVQHILLRDGKEFNAYAHYDYATRNYRGLPAGNYTLKVKSSQEKTSRGGLPTYPAYAGAQKQFAVDAASPVTIDLGAILLTAPSNPG